MPLPQVEEQPKDDPAEVDDVAVDVAVDVGMFEQDYKRERKRILTNLNNPQVSRDKFNEQLEGMLKQHQERE